MKVYFSFLVRCFLIANWTLVVISFTTTIPRGVKRDVAARTPATPAGRDVRIANSNIIQSNNNGNKAVTTTTATILSSSTLTSSIAEASRIETEQEEEAASLTSVQQSTFSFPIQVAFSPPPLGTATNADTTKTSQDLMQESRNIILSWYDEFIESTSFFQRDPKDAFKFTIPLFHTTTVTLSEQEGEKEGQQDKEIGESERPSNCLFFKIHVDGATEKDYAMLCAKIYESQQEYNRKLLTSSCAEKGEGGCAVIENACLKDIVQTYFRQVKPHPGYDAKGFSFDEGNDNHNDDSTIGIKDILNPSLLDELLTHGFVTVDTNITTTASEIDALSNVLTSKTVQERTVRSDTVAFIDSDMAKKCGIQKQFGMLMEIANYLNQNLQWDSMRSGYKPISPATERCPLTNPANVQIASYGHGEFYVPHSDNLLVEGQNHERGAGLVRSNYRQFTCILYCNDDWDMKVHGGALRIYPDTIDVTDPMSVKARNVPYTDVNPINGKLLIFDSRLVHSVEKVLDPYKKRLAMTIWINRPEDNGVSVNVWNENEERVEWYRLF